MRPGFKYLRNLSIERLFVDSDMNLKVTEDEESVDGPSNFSFLR